MATSQQKIVLLPSPNVQSSAQVIQGQPIQLNSGGGSISGYLIPIASQGNTTAQFLHISVPYTMPAVLPHPSLATAPTLTAQSNIAATAMPSVNSTLNTLSLPTVSPPVNTAALPTVISPHSPLPTVISPVNRSAVPMVNAPLVNHSAQQTPVAPNIHITTTPQTLPTNSGVRTYIVVQRPNNSTSDPQKSLGNASTIPAPLTQSQIEELISYLQAKSKSTVQRVIYPSPVSKPPTQTATKTVVFPGTPTVPLQPALSKSTSPSAVSMHGYCLSNSKRKQELVSRQDGHGTVQTVPCKISKPKSRKIVESKSGTIIQNVKHRKKIHSSKDTTAGIKSQIKNKRRIRLMYLGRERDKCTKENLKWNSAELTSQKHLPRGIAGKLFASAVGNVDSVLDQYNASQQALETISKVYSQTNSVNHNDSNCAPKLKPYPFTSNLAASINTDACVNMNNNKGLISKANEDSIKQADTNATLTQPSVKTTLMDSNQETRIRLCFIVLQKLPASFKLNIADGVSFHRAQVLLAKNGRCSVKCREDVVRNLYKHSKKNPYPMVLKPHIVFNNPYLCRASISPIIPVTNQITNFNHTATPGITAPSHSPGKGVAPYIRVEASSANILCRPCVIKNDVKAILKECSKTEMSSDGAKSQTSPVPLISPCHDIVNSSLVTDGALNESDSRATVANDQDSICKANNKNCLTPVCLKTPTKRDLCNNFPVPNWKYNELNNTYSHNASGTLTRLGSSRRYGKMNKLSQNPMVIVSMLPKKHGKLIISNTEAGSETVVSGTNCHSAEKRGPVNSKPASIIDETVKNGNYASAPCTCSYNSPNGQAPIKGLKCSDLKDGVDRKVNTLAQAEINTLTHSMELSDHSDTSTLEKYGRSSTRRQRIHVQPSVDQISKLSANLIPMKNSQTASLSNISNCRPTSRKPINLGSEEQDLTLKKKTVPISTNKRSDLKDVKIESVSRLKKLDSKSVKTDSVCAKQNLPSRKSKLNRECRNKNVLLSVAEIRNISERENSLSRKRKLDCQHENMANQQESGKLKIPKLLKNGHLKSKKATHKLAVRNKAKKLSSLEHVNSLSYRTRNRTIFNSSSISEVGSSFTDMTDGKVSFSLDSQFDSSYIDEDVSFNLCSQVDNPDSDDEVSFNIGSQVDCLDGDDEVSFNFTSRDDHSEAYHSDFPVDSYTDGEVSFSLAPCNVDRRIGKKPLPRLLKTCSNIKDNNLRIKSKPTCRKVTGTKKHISNSKPKPVSHVTSKVRVTRAVKQKTSTGRK